VAYLPTHISEQAMTRFQEAVPTVKFSSFQRPPEDYLKDSEGK